MEGLITSADAAALLGVSRSWLSRLVRRGDLRVAREGFQGGHVRHWFRDIDVRCLIGRRQDKAAGVAVQGSTTGFFHSPWLAAVNLRERRRGMLTASEVAARLGVSRAWISILGRRGMLVPSLRGWDGRTFRAWYDQADVIAYQRRRAGALDDGSALSYMGLGPVRFVRC